LQRADQQEKIAAERDRFEKLYNEMQNDQAE
jgi:hypothetical protein